MRARVGVTESHREPKIYPVRARESQLEPEGEIQRAIESQRETGRDPVRARVLLQNN